MKIRQPSFFSSFSKRVDISVSNAAPVFKTDSKLESGRCGPHELLLINPQQFMKSAHWRDRSFSNSYGSNFRRFHQDDVKPIAELPRQCCSSNPSCGTAAGNNHPLNH